MINLLLWCVTIVFPLQASVALLVGGLAVYMVCVPYVEAAEQTVLQKVVPYERQGRVFGFQQSVEQSASPLTAFLISPLTQFIFVPFMTDGAGARWIGGWFGTGQARGIALVFVVVGLLGLGLTAYALSSRYYRVLSARYLESPLAAPDEALSPDSSRDTGPVWHAAGPAGRDGKGPDGTEAGIERRSRHDAG